MLEVAAVDLTRRDVAAVLPSNYDPAEAADAKTPSKLRRQVAAAGGVTPASAAGVTLRTNVLDSLSLSETLEEDTQVRIRAAHRRANDGNSSSLKEIQKFDDEFLYTSRVGFGVDRLVRENDLILKLDWFEKFGTPISTPDPEVWEPMIARLLTSLIPKAEHDKYRQEMRTQVTRPLFPFGDANMPDVLLSMNTFSRTDVMGATRSALQTLQNEVEYLEKQIEETAAAFEEAKAREEFERAAAKSEELLALRGKKFDVTMKKMSLLASGDVQSGGLLAKLDAILRAPGVAEAEEERNDYKKKAQADIATLEADRVTKLKQNEAAISAYNDRCAESRSQLRRNYKQQDEAWAQIETLLDKIQSLGEESRKMAGMHMKDTETEQKRRKEFSEYKESYASHHNLLDDLIRNCDAGVTYIHDVQTYLVKGREVIAEMKAEEQVLELLGKEKKMFSSVFYDFAELCGRSMERYATRSLGVEQMLRNYKFQQNQAPTVDDTDASTYGKQINGMEANLKVLRKKGDKLQADFEHREGQFLDVWERSGLADAVEEEEGMEPEGEGEEEEDYSAAASLRDDQRADPLLRVKRLIASIRSKYISELKRLTDEDSIAVEQERKIVEELSASVERTRAAKTPHRDRAAEEESASPVEDGVSGKAE